ncbi:MAG: VCBS repeat-containing protein [Verrucomicrobiales bacterium]|nr:VCBS repeat-containing protein [Verrucomicrobiales bacterium]
MQLRFLFIAVILSFFSGKLCAFDNDFEEDIVWHYKSQLLNDAWIMRLNVSADFIDHSSTASIQSSSDSGWEIVATADFNRDGHADLLWRNKTTGHNLVWFMDRTTLLSNPPPTETSAVGAVDWDVAGTGDFNADGFIDILWQNKTLNLQYVWLMDNNPNGSPAPGTHYITSVPLSTVPGTADWIAVATGDCDNDGDPDIVFRNKVTGQVALWFMNGTTLVAGVIVSQSSLDWKLVTTGHFNPVGNTDFVWRNTSGQNAIWLMSKETLLKGIPIETRSDPNWTIGGTGGYRRETTMAASVTTSPLEIRLAWNRYGEFFGTAPALSIYRRQFGNPGGAWTLLGSTYQTFYKDTCHAQNNPISASTRYEYKLVEFNLETYLLTAVQGTVRPEDKNRGKVILLVESGMAGSISTDLDAFKDTLAADGWGVKQINVTTGTSVSSVRDTLKLEYNTGLNGYKHVLIIGHVPVPYSGSFNDDNHGFRVIPADAYYGDMDGVYTDGTSFAYSFDWTDEPRLHNNIGDGKWDQNALPGNAKVELGVGRVDFINLSTSFPGKTETQLIRDYLAKDTRYRRKQIAALPDRLVAGSWYVPSDSSYPGLHYTTYTDALRTGTRHFGLEPGKTLDGDAFADPTGGVWGFHYGNGGPYNAVRYSGGSGYPAFIYYSSNCASTSTEPRIHFLSLRGSYLADWDTPESLLRSFLATPTYGLVASWRFSLIPLRFEQSALGEPIGTGFMRSLNETPGHDIHFALLGDPTLRVQIVGPPSPSTFTMSAVPNPEA